MREGRVSTLTGLDLGQDSKQPLAAVQFAEPESRLFLRLLILAGAAFVGTLYIYWREEVSFGGSAKTTPNKVIGDTSGEPSE